MPISAANITSHSIAPGATWGNVAIGDEIFVTTYWGVVSSITVIDANTFATKRTITISGQTISTYALGTDGKDLYVFNSSGKACIVNRDTGVATIVSGIVAPTGLSQTTPNFWIDQARGYVYFGNRATYFIAANISTGATVKQWSIGGAGGYTNSVVLVGGRYLLCMNYAPAALWVIDMAVAIDSTSLVAVSGFTTPHSSVCGALWLTNRNKFAVNSYSQAYIDDYDILGMIINSGFLRAGGLYYRTDGTTLISFGEGYVPTPSDYQQYGRYIYPKSIISLLPAGSSVDIVVYQAPENSRPTMARTIAVPTGKVILSESDIGLQSVQAINSVSITANTAGSGIIKVICSVDQGTTWQTWDATNSTWCTLKVNEAKDKGMTAAVLNARTKGDWASLVKTNTSGIRFGYYIEETASTDVANTDILTLNVDMKGIWFEAQPWVDYKAGYPASSTAVIVLMANGDYKINY